MAITRAETAQFCRELELSIWEDPSNQDLKYARNRIRHELLPYLQNHFNPQVEHTLSQTAELLQADVGYLEQEAAKLLEQSQHPTQLKLNRVLIRQAPLALQRRVIRQWLRAVLHCSPNFDQIEKVVALLSAPNRSQTDPFPGGAIAHVENDWIQLKCNKL